MLLVFYVVIVIELGGFFFKIEILKCDVERCGGGGGLLCL